MTAKEMAVRFNAAPELNTVADLLFEELNGTRTLALQRKISTDSGMASILRETDDRWRAFAKLCPQINPDGFKLVLHRELPSSKILLP